MQEIMMNLLTELLMLLGTLLVGFAIQFIRKRVGTEKLTALREALAAKREIVDTAVLFVQQAYEEIDGELKLAKALSTAAAWITAQGLTVTEDELKSMIEASVKAMKKEFADQWWTQPEPGDAPTALTD